MVVADPLAGDSLADDPLADEGVVGAVVDSLSDGTLVGEALAVVVGASTGTRSVADGGTV